MPKDLYENFELLYGLLSDWEEVKTFLTQTPLGTIVQLMILLFGVYIVVEVVKNWLAPLVRLLSPKDPVEKVPPAPGPAPTPPRESATLRQLRELSMRCETRVQDSRILKFVSMSSSATFRYLRKNLLQPTALSSPDRGGRAITAQELEDSLCGQRKLILLGGGGSGKSTLLKSCFLDLRSQGRLVLFAEAKPLLARADRDMRILWSLLSDDDLADKLGGQELVVFLDGVDEAVWPGGMNPERFWRKLDQAHCTVVAACRAEFFHREEPPRECQFGLVQVEQWKLEQSLEYASHFLEDGAKLAQVERLSGQAAFQSILTNPFLLTLFLYLLKVDGMVEEEGCHIYWLYEAFLRHFLEYEYRRVDQEARVEDRLDTLMAIARSLYMGKSCTYSDDDPGIRQLLRMNGRTSTVDEFVHRTIRDFLVARELVESFRSRPDRIPALLSAPHRDDVNDFVKDAFERLPREPGRLEQTVENLCTVLENGSGAAYTFTQLNQIVYYITRLPIQPASIEFAWVITQLHALYGHHSGGDWSNVLLRQGIAYGLAIYGVKLEDMDERSQSLRQKCWAAVLGFAGNLTPGSPEDQCNRAWTLVFYGDVTGVDGAVYRDEQKVDWSQAREARIRRLGETRQKSVAFRVLDLKLLLMFHRDRNWKDISPWGTTRTLGDKKREVWAVWNSDRDLPRHFSREMEALIRDTRRELLQGYTKYNPLLTICLWGLKLRHGAGR